MNRINAERLLNMSLSNIDSVGLHLFITYNNDIIVLMHFGSSNSFVYSEIGIIDFTIKSFMNQSGIDFMGIA